VDPTSERVGPGDLSDASRFEPDDNGGDDHHRPVVDGAFFVARSESTPLLEPIDAALDHIASRIDGRVEGQRAARSAGAVRALIAALRDGVRDLPPSEQLAT
jgi:hypothetical protein